jgi:hypothetical protein
VKHLLELHGSGNYTEAEPAELFSLGRSTIDRTIDRMGPKPVEPERPSAHVLPRFQTTEIRTPPSGQGRIGRKRARKPNGEQAALHVSNLPFRHIT